MNRRTILFLMNSDTPDAQISEAAEAAAAQETHLVCLMVDVSPILPMYAYGMAPYGGMNIPDNWGDLVSEAREKQKQRVDAVEALLARSNASGDVQPVMCDTAEIKHIVATAARASDEAFMASNLRDTSDVMREAASGILFHSPIGLRLNGAVGAPVTRVFVAWDSSEAATTALHAALPYLKEAKEVMITCIDPVMTLQGDGQDPGTDVAAWLSHHGCNVTVSQFPGGGRDTAEILQSHAQEFGADLVVMGAYGHARMIQTVLGGTTRAMVAQTELPVFLSH